MAMHKRVLSAVSWLSLGNFVARLLSLVTMPVLTRHLSPQAYGAASLVGTVVSLASVVALAGIEMGYARHLFSGRVGSAEAVEAFCWRWTLGSAAAVALLAGVSWWISAKPLSLPTSLAAFAVSGVFASALSTMTRVRARLQGRYVRMTWVQFATGCVGAAVSLAIGVWWRQDAWALLVAMVMGYLLPVLLLGMPPWRMLLAPSGLDHFQRRGLLMTGLAGVVTAPAYWVLSSSDRWFLAAFRDSSVVGIYSIGYTVGTVGMVVSSAVINAWLPELAREESVEPDSFSEHKVDMAQLLAAILMIVAVAVAAAGGDTIRWLADPRFHSAAMVVPWLAAGVLFYGCLHVGSALLVLRGKLHWAGLAWGASLLASLLLNGWLVPRYGAWGAAVAQAISFFLAMVLVWLAVLHFDRIQMRWAALIGGFMLSMLAILLMQPGWSLVAWHSLLLKLPVGLCFALACVGLVAPRMLQAGILHLKGAI